MIYDIRNISFYINTIHSRYYIDTTGTIFTSLGGDTNRIMIDGVRYNISGFKRSNLHLLNKSNKMIMRLPQSANYFLLYDGTILKRLSTRRNSKNEIDVSLTTLNGRDKGTRWSVSRLMGFVFLGLTQDKEVHHIDGDRTNNQLENLQVLTFEEHRGKQNFSKNHNL